MSAAMEGLQSTRQKIVDEIKSLLPAGEADARGLQWLTTDELMHFHREALLNAIHRLLPTHQADSAIASLQSSNTEQLAKLFERLKSLKTK
jgi:hypothetical protein